MWYHSWGQVIPADEQTVFMIKLGALAIPVGQLREMYDKQNFESQVPGFCSSIGIPLPGA